jgi:ABC-2 type transport system ATP-binding protein
LVGLLAPTAGHVAIAGCDIATQRLSALKNLGYVPEAPALYPLLTPFELVELVGELHQLDAHDLAEKRALFFARFELDAVAGRSIATLSKGQRQKLALITALVHDPRVLVLDEPLDGLDANAARTVKELLRALASQGCAVLFSSHQLEMVERFCSRVIMLRSGSVVADAPTAELVDLAAGRTLESVFSDLSREAG